MKALSCVARQKRIFNVHKGRFEPEVQKILGYLIEEGNSIQLIQSIANGTQIDCATKA